MIKIINGDLLKATDRDIILHQVNCKGVMGGGIAKQIRQQHPNLYWRYYIHCKQNTHLLGTVLYYRLPQYIIANCFGQDDYGRTKQYTDYEALQKCFIEIGVLADKYREQGNDLKIGIPYKIGCGLGGGDWDIVYKMICEIFEGLDVVIYRKG